ncbi:DUF6283 family protein [Nonomuraea polychroma]|uniref:DUF6283 family protein n=1 Tax=Nonomuraea polychroma TaxID=46176 RepID=UPI003D8BAB26
MRSEPHRTPDAAIAELAELSELPEGVVRVRDGANGWGVTTIVTRKRDAEQRDHQEEPCRRCPWRKDAPTGAFPPEVFQHSATTSYDLAVSTFACHASSPGEPPLTCAGFLLRGAAHNLSIRLSSRDYSDVRTTIELYSDYVDMAVANGVPADDPVLAPCRRDQYTGDRLER